MRNLVGIVRNATLAPELRRSAAKQLLALAADKRFQAVLAAPALLESLLAEVTQPQAYSCEGGDAQSGAGLAGMKDVQLQLAYLELLTSVCRHCEDACAWLQEHADR